jgi:hypothetical protein
MPMRKSLLMVPVAMCLAALLSSSTALAADNWVGTWKLNVAASKFSPGPAPKSQVLKFASEKGGIKLTNDEVDGTGKAIKGTYTAKFDGKEVPWKGNPDADTAAPKRIDDNSYDNTWKKGGKVTIVAKVVVSPDGKTLTITQTGKNAKGETVDNTAVLDRQ